MLKFVRNLLGGGKPVHDRRRVPVAGPRPSVGASLVKSNVVMKVTQPISDDFWNWLVLVGWREVRMSKNRRKYVAAPAGTLATLAKASIQDRDEKYRELLGPMTSGH